MRRTLDRRAQLWSMGLLAMLLLGALAQPNAARATASWLYHGGNIVAGGAATNAVLPGQAVTVWLKVGYDGYINQARIYYTTNGSEPQGSYDTVSTGVNVAMTFDHTEADPGGTVAWWKGVIPAQAQGVQVRYKIAAWHSGGGDIVYAESPVGKTLTTSADATTFGYYVSAFSTPQWAKDAIIYQVFIDRFYDGSTANNVDCTATTGGYCVNDIFQWNGGDLAGVQSRIDYLQSLGVNTLWLSPVYDNPKTQIGSETDATPGVIYNYHGYEALDFNNVDSNFGTTATLQSVVNTAHAAGMKVILDFVPNHSSNQHPYFKSASDSCSSSPYFRWYKFGTVNAQGRLQSYDATKCVAGHTTWWGDNDTYANFFGVKEMPQLDNDFGPARKAMIDQALSWVNTYGIDGLRLDYAPGPSHSFWMAFRAAVKAANPNAYLVGEVWTDGGAAERKSYQGELDGVLSFDHNDLFLNFFAKRNTNVDSFDSGLANLESYYTGEYVLPTFLDNHDKDRFLFEAGQNTGRLKLAFTAQMTLTEPPVIYYGTEVGLTQSEASAGKPERSRGRMLWGGYLASPPDGWNNAQNTDVRDLVKTLISLRKQHSALRTGARVSLYRHNADGTMAYRRTDASGSVLVALNNSDSTRTLSVPNLPGATLNWPDGTLVEDKLSGATYTVTAGKVNLTLAALKGAVLVPVGTTATVPVTFTVDGFVTVPGQDLYVVGSAPELGNWDAAQAVPLTWIDNDTWSGPVTFASSKGQAVQYKYIVRQGASTTWESIGNRSYSVPSSGSGSVHNIWNQAGTVGGGAAPALGANLVSGGVQFNLFSQNATRVQLSIYSSASATTPSSTHLLTKDASTNVWSATVSGAGVGTLYGYRVWGPNWEYMSGWTPGTAKASDTGFHAHADASGNRFNPNKLLTDPYARAVTGEVARVTSGGQTHYSDAYIGGTDSYAFVDSGPVAPKSIVVDPSFDWSGDVKPNTSMKDSVIYEVHLRGFTRGDTTIDASIRGTYDGFAAKAAHLKELGVTAVELLPTHEYPQFDDPIASQGATADRANYWGYMTSQFFAPNREYLCPDVTACSYTAGQQVREFKEMVKALHAQGIEVWMDVVFNHTAEGGSDNGKVKYLNLRGIDNQSYYTLDDDRTAYWESTGVGNNLNGSRAPARQLVLDSLKYWIDEMHVDGFRFDLAYELGREGSDGRTFNGNAQLLRDIAALGSARDVKMIAEAWDTKGYGVGQFPDGWSEWNGKMRDTTRRFVRSDADQAGKLATAISSNEIGFATPPESVNFVTAHDGFTLNDLVSYNAKQNGVGACNPTGADPNSGSNDNDSWDSGGDDTLRRRQIRNFAVQLMTDQGAPMIVAGDEFRQTQNGNNNAYMADNSCGWLNWQNKIDHAGTYQFFRKMIALRKAHPALRRGVRFDETDGDVDGYKDLTWHGVTPDAPDWSVSSRTLAFLLDGSAGETGAGGDAPDLYVAHNGYWQDLSFTLPTAPNGKKWYVVVNTASTAESAGNIYYNPTITDWNLQPLPKLTGSSFSVQARSTIVLVARPDGAATP